MDEPQETSRTSDGSSPGRDAQGRFVAGCPGGPGRPPDTIAFLDDIHLMFRLQQLAATVERSDRIGNRPRRSLLATIRRLQRRLAASQQQANATAAAAESIAEQFTVLPDVDPAG